MLGIWWVRCANKTERCKGADGPVGPEKSVEIDGVGDGE